MEFISQTVTITRILAILFATTVCFAFPILGMVYAKKRYKARWTPIIMGAAIFITFGIFLKGIGSSLLVSIPVVRELVGTNLIFYAIFVSLLAGIFEETGRFVAFKLMKNKCTNTGEAIAYGVGHGGIEAILLVGIGMISSFVMAITVNLSGADALIQGVDQETATTIIEGVNSLTQTEASLFFASGVERFVAMAFHIAASLLVYTAVRKPGYIYLYPLAILLHTVLNIPAGLFQVGLMGEGILLTEILIAVIAAAICVFTYFIIKKTKGIANKQ